MQTNTKFNFKIAIYVKKSKIYLKAFLPEHTKLQLQILIWSPNNMHYQTEFHGLENALHHYIASPSKHKLRVVWPPTPHLL